MLRIKKLDIFIVKSFSLLFVGTFFICLFIFMMQFLWRYVDELVGKGLAMTVMAEFFFYSALTLVPASIPLAVLLSSLITFGNFGERYELLAMKAAGISLLKIMRPLVVFVSILVCISFYFQNVIGPMAQGKLGTLLVSMKQKSPEVDIPEGVFYSDIPGFNLRVEKKNRETGMLYDMLIYRMTEGFENAQIIYADSGRMETTADKQHFLLHLYSGELFENLKAQNMRSSSVPYRRETFREKHSIIEYDSEFNMVDGSIMSNMAASKNIKQLQSAIDSMTVVGDSIGRSYYRDITKGPLMVPAPRDKEDTLKIEKANLREYNVDSVYQAAALAQKQRVMASAVSKAENVAGDLNFKTFSINGNDYTMRRHAIEWHRKIAVALSCLFFFFIGAPLGGIIRKGGLGMPVIMSVLIFITYFIIDNSGYKMARDGKWIIWMSMWLSSVVLVAMGAFFTYKANNDSVVLNADAYVAWFKRVAGIRSVRHIFRKDVIITDPDFARLPGDLDELSADCRAYMAKRQLTKAPNYLSLWLTVEDDHEIASLNERLEALVDEMSNTRSVSLLNALNEYPIIAVSAHVRPFPWYWVNILAGLVVPVGIFFYFRIWMFRIRLNKDLERVVRNNEEVQHIIATKMK